MDDQTLPASVTGKGGKIIPIAPMRAQPKPAVKAKGMPPIALSHTQISKQAAKTKLQSWLSSPEQRAKEQQSLDTARKVLADWTVVPAAQIAGAITALAMEPLARIQEDKTGKAHPPITERMAIAAEKAGKAVTPNVSDGAKAKAAIMELPLEKVQEINRKAGLNITELTGSEWAGALAESSFNIADFMVAFRADPAAAVKLLSGKFKSPAPAEPHVDAFKDMAAKDPSKAKEVHDQVQAKSPQTAALLRSKVTPDQKAALLQSRPKDNTPAILKPKGPLPPEPPKSTTGAIPVLQGGLGYGQASIAQLPKSEQPAAILRNSVQQVKSALQDVTPSDAKTEGIKRLGNRLSGVGAKQGGAIDLEGIKKAFTFKLSNPLINSATQDLKASIQHFKETFAPASLSEHGKLAEALIAQKIVTRLAKGEVRYTHGKERSAYWDTQKDKGLDFIAMYGRGDKFSLPEWKQSQEFYREAFQAEYERDMSNGVMYEPEENYFARVFVDGPTVEEYFQNKYGKKWGDPNFTKGRDFEFLEDALKAGYKLKTNNPEILYQMRAAASDIAESRINALRTLAEQGLARKVARGKGVVKTKNYPNGGDPVRAPNGDLYYIDPGIRALFNNAFDTNSLWNQKGAIGAIFRGTTALKNPLVMLDLGLSGFHAVHTVAGMVPGSAIARAAQLAASGSVKSGLLEMINGLTYGGESGIPLAGQLKDGILGNRAVRIFKGEVASKDIMPHELAEQQLMLEGGFSPLLDAKYKSGWRGSFATALRQKSLTAVPKALLAAMEKSSSWMTEGLVPSLKADVYLKNVTSWIKANPDLAGDSNARAIAFRKIAKSIENRFGQMNYDTMFWKRSVKDWAIWSSLSMGWKYGFMREFVAGPLTESPSVLHNALRDNLPQGGLRRAIARGELDRTIFVMGYLGVTALAYNAISTYIHTGQGPTGWLDYIYPPNGQKNPDGSKQRESNPYYTRDIARMVKMVDNDGVVKGLTEFFGASVGPQVPAIKEFLTGVDSMGHEVSDPSADWLTKFWQRAKHIASEQKPIVIQSLEKETGQDNILDALHKSNSTQVIRNWLGFGRAPKYIEQSSTQAKITSIYQKYYAKSLQPFESVERGQDRAKLRQLYQSDQHDEFMKKLTEMKHKYHLNHRQMQDLHHSVKLEGTVRMFQAFTVEQQLKLLKDMTPDERRKYMKHAHKETKHSFYKWQEDNQ